MFVYTHCPRWTRVIGRSMRFCPTSEFPFEFEVSNPLVVLLLLHCSSVCSNALSWMSKVVGFSTMSNFQTSVWSSKCLNPLVGSLAFPHFSSKCSYALSWIGKALRPFVDLLRSFALHGFKTSEVPATWGGSTDERRVSFQGGLRRS